MTKKKMSLKEAFRYQRFLEQLMDRACNCLVSEPQCLKTTELHLCSKVDPDREDFSKEGEELYPFSNDDTIALVECLVNEREALSIEISKAKTNIAIDDGLDIDAEISANKFRHQASEAIQTALQYAPSVRVGRGTGYKFNIDGNQSPYIYDVEVTKEINYNQDRARFMMKNFNAIADDKSSQIDLAMVKPTVDYKPPFDVNDGFEDVMKEFVSNMK